MRDILPDLQAWLDQGQPVALATVLSTWGSAPRRAGAVMAVNAAGGIAGSVSGGCVEGAVVEAAQQVLASGEGRRLHFDVADETAWNVGLACGGEIEIFVHSADPDLYDELIAKLQAGGHHSLATVVAGPDSGRQWLATDAHVRQPELREDDGRQVFYNPLPTPPTLVMVGGVHIAVALARLAKTLDYRTVVVDPRRAFGSPDRFPEVNELIHAYPQKAFETRPLDANTALASLSHDPKIDDPALEAALRSKAFYIGALGSRRTQAKRLERLEEAGFSKKELARIHGPIGLEIGAETPEEIALAILAQVVAAHRS